jgi:hypothetical protein
MRLLHLQRIPNQLREQLRAIKTQKYHELPPLREGMEANKFRNILTNDQSWFTFEHSDSAEWIFFWRRSARTGKTVNRPKKFILIVISRVNVFHVVDLMMSQGSFNSEYFEGKVMTPTIAKVFSQGRSPHIRRLSLHLDKYRVHFSKIATQFVIENHILPTSHPPYGPDLVPSDFRLFRPVKDSPVG